MKMKKSDIVIILFIALIYILMFSNVVQSASVEGVSMYPIFQNGALTFYVKPFSINVGNVIIYKSPYFNNYVIHRVVATNNGYYITQGIDKITNPIPDNRIGLEPPSGIPENLVVGKIIEFGNFTFSIPYLGYISILFSSII
ncbi:signal peptidase I [Sulfolobus sp. E5-1-F]|uniref:signal peptidase I n=1 Tax=Sulfolobaceae TaxID=118883 RepID=UPI001297490A|nr:MULTISPECIES: signal peptidase I [unclassified Sulfolobus]QGA54393.1 signal peptidase I [Sulfolobus sp. E5-1-F]QGA69438.1 signal peptidase I [Sulfolobus sp. E11-6]